MEAIQTDTAPKLAQGVTILTEQDNAVNSAWNGSEYNNMAEYVLTSENTPKDYRIAY